MKLSDAPSELAPVQVEITEIPQNSITLSSFGHMAINIGLSGAAVLGSIGIAEATLYLLQLHKKQDGIHLKEDASRQFESVHKKDQAIREQEALQVLLDIAEKHARKISEGGYGKFRPFTVPKEIHQSLESVFEDGTTNVEAYHNLKEAFSPLLDFE